MSCIENGLIQVRANGENEVFQITNEIDGSQISPSQESSNVDTESTEENYMQQNEEKDCATLETFKNDPSRVVMNEKVGWICAEVQKIKEFQAVAESKFIKPVIKYYSSSVCRTFNEVDMTLRQPEGWIQLLNVLLLHLSEISVI